MLHTILVVAEDESMRVLLRTSLRRNGYGVLDAQSASEALLICRQFPVKIDLLVTDMAAVQMVGWQVAEQLLDLCGGRDVLYVSSYPGGAPVVACGTPDSGVAFIEQPITSGALVRKVRELLDAARRRERWR